ncbi:MAG: hypothetical protein WDM87_04755 [Terracidiphilus sp.]
MVPALHHLSHLPILVDPSHGTGRVTAFSQWHARPSLPGADGLIVEVPQPS